jgi:hypothetical protein
VATDATLEILRAMPRTTTLAPLAKLLRASDD